MTITVILLPNKEKIDPMAINTIKKYFPINAIRVDLKVSRDMSLIGISQSF